MNENREVTEDTQRYQRSLLEREMSWRGQKELPREKNCSRRPLHLLQRESSWVQRGQKLLGPVSASISKVMLLPKKVLMKAFPNRSVSDEVDLDGVGLEELMIQEEDFSLQFTSGSNKEYERLIREFERVIDDERDDELDAF
jgi:hypothetical protein